MSTAALGSHRTLLSWWFAACFLPGCATFGGHTAEVESQQLPPLPDPITRHTSRVLIQLPKEATDDSQCVAYEGYQTLCFVGIRSSLEQSLSGLLWPSFPEVRVRRRGDELKPGDYLVQVELRVDALPPDASRYGWSAAAKGRWRVVRDGLPVRGESLSTRSRGDFAYGSGLGQAAGEVVDAVAAHIAQIMVTLPESEPHPVVLLPPVVAKDSFVPDAEPGGELPEEAAGVRVAGAKADAKPTAPSSKSGDRQQESAKASDVPPPPVPPPLPVSTQQAKESAGR